MFHYETGKANYSLYMNGQHFYFTKDRQELLNEQGNAGYKKNTRSEYEYNMQTFWGSLGGDYVFSDKDYLSFSSTYTNTFSPPSEMQGSGSFLQLPEEKESKFDAWSTSRTTYYVSTNNLYYKHTFSDKKLLETTFRFNFNRNEMTGERKETYDNLPDYHYLYEYDNSRLSSSLEVNYNAAWSTHSFDLGSQTYFTNDRIKQLPAPAFRYKEWNEYLYAGLSGSFGGPLLYSVSLGADMIFNQSQDQKNRYIRLKPVVSAKYQFNPANTLVLAYRLDNIAPVISQLNPYNTSTDSLYRQVGNPFLLPEQDNIFTLSYSFNKGPVYLEPSFTYTLSTDEIVETGRMEGNVFTRTYTNEGSYREWDGMLTLRYNSARWGSLGGYAGYRHSYYSLKDEGTFYTSVNFNLRYRKLSANGYVYYQPYNYSPVYSSRSYAPESELTLGWRLNNNFTLNAGMRYFLGGLKTQTTTDSEGYYARNTQTHLDRRFLVNIGFNYYWRSKVPAPQRTKVQLQGTESGITL
jgi:hypothetical protein